MGIFNDDETKKSICKVGQRGPPGLSIKGDSGPEGPPGSTGPVGSDGIDGATGPVGADGPAGDKGDRGFRGRTGDKGNMGDRGAPGPTGPTGPPGAVAPAGADGVTGPTGAKGDPGNDGAVGPAGDYSNVINLLHYNGNPYLLTKIPIKESSYFIFREPNNIITSNTDGLSIFDYFTDAELKIKKSALWDVILYDNIKTSRDTDLLCEVWKHNDQGKFIQTQDIKIPIPNSNGVAKMLYFNFSVKVDADEILEIYIQQGHGKFIGGWCFIQENGENRKFKNLVVEKAEITDLKITSPISDLSAIKASITDLICTRETVENLTVTDTLLYPSGDSYNNIPHKVPNMRYLHSIIIPMELIRFRPSTRILIMRPFINSNILLFQEQYFTYTTPNKQITLNQLYLVHSTYIYFQITLFHTLISKELYPDSTSDTKFDDKRNICLLIRHIDKPQTNLLNESVLFDGTLDVYNQNSSATILVYLQQNDRLRIENKNYKPNKNFPTEIMLKITAIA